MLNTHPRKCESSVQQCKILIVPGLMGSALMDTRGGQGALWGQADQTRIGNRFKHLQLAADGIVDLDERVRISVDGVVRFVYCPLIDSLTRSKLGSVEVFPYDWRKPIEQAGSSLESLIRDFLIGSPDRSIIIVAHSMGGLVAARAIAELGTLVKQIKGMIAFGVPWLGSYEIALALRSEGMLLRLLSDLTGLGCSATADILQTFWGWTDLLPVDSTILTRSFFGNGTIGVSRASELQLRSPTTLPRAFQIPVLPIVGMNRRTPIAVSERSFDLMTVMAEGDGIVPFVGSTALGTLPPIIVPSNHFRLTMEQSGIQAAVQQVGIWLQGPDCRMPEIMCSPSMPLWSGGVRRLKARLSRSLSKSRRRTLRVADFWTLLEGI